MTPIERISGTSPILARRTAGAGSAGAGAGIYGIVFVVVLVSVVVQGSLVPTVAARLGVPMVDADSDEEPAASQLQA